MKLIKTYLIAIPLLLFNNYCTNNDEIILQFDNKLNHLNQKYIPDKSLAVSDISFSQNNKSRIITGKTTSKALYHELLAFSDSLSYKFDVLLLPDTALGDSTHGIVNISTVPIRESPSHTSQMIDQAILGNSLKILHELDDWYLIQTHYDYAGWITKSSVYRCDLNKIKKWNLQAKYQVNKIHSVIYSDSNKSSDVISYLVMNNRLKRDISFSEWAKVILPDDRFGFMQKADLKDMEVKIPNTKFRKNIFKIAMSMKGIPYLWGGNSSKGNDCSGFTQTVYNASGFLIPRDARQQAELGIIIDPKDAKIGDLFFFGDGERVTHVAISIGGLDFIHQGSKYEGKVDIHSLDSNSDIYSEYRRETFMFAKHIDPTKL